MDVKTIIEKTRKSIENASYDMVPTFKNQNSRWKHGLTIYDLEDFLLNLDSSDLVKGPVADRDYPNEELFVFKKEIIPGVVFYVKLKEKNNQIKIISCHEDEN